MARQEWEAGELRRLAADLRLLAQGISDPEAGRIKRFASELELRAAEMESASGVS